MTFEKELQLISKGAEEIIPMDELKAKLAKSAKSGKPLRIKYGIDPTGHEIHIGHLVPIRKMRDFQDLGHTGVIIIGDFTAQIGDPTGRDESRPPLTHDEVRANSEKYMEQLYTILKPEQTEVRYQSEWFTDMTLKDVLQILGKFIGRLAHDTFRDRHEQDSLGMHELMYPVLQSYDSLRRKRCGTGRNRTEVQYLLRTTCNAILVWNSRSPCLLILWEPTAEQNGQIPEQLHCRIRFPADKYGKVMSIPDSLIINYYTYAAYYDIEEIEKVKAELDKGTNPMILKKKLAYEVVKIYHGDTEAAKAQKGFEDLFSKREIPDEMPEYTPEADEVWIVKLLVDSGLCKSNGEARRLITGGGISIDGERINSFDTDIKITDGSVLRAGKRRFIRLRKK